MVGPSLPHARISVDEPPEVADGCNVSPSCFTCPLPDCKWEAPRARAAIIWDQQALALFSQHKELGTARAVVITARELGVSERRIYRMLQRQRPAA
jgi:hypothetical protein